MILHVLLTTGHYLEPNTTYPILYLAMPYGVMYAIAYPSISAA